MCVMEIIMKTIKILTKLLLSVMIMIISLSVTALPVKARPKELEALEVLSTNKTQYKIGESIIVSVSVNVASNYPGYNPDYAWVCLLPEGEVPAESMSVRWHYVHNIGNSFDMLETLLMGTKVDLE